MNKQMNKCILCNSNDTELIEILDHKDLTGLYLKTFKINVSSILKDDIKFILCKRCDLRFFQPDYTGDEKFYNCLQKYEWYYQDRKYEYDFAKQFVKKNARILEVGCGKGAFAKYIDNSVKYTGLDFSIEAREMASINGIEIKNDSIHEYAKKQKKHDVVCSFQVLEHVIDPYDFIKSSLKCLRKNGLLIIAVPSESSFVRYASNSILNMPPHHVSRWTDKSLNSISRLFSVEVVTLHHEPLSAIHKDWYLNTLIETVLFKKKKDLIMPSSRFEKYVKKVLKHLLIKRLQDEFMPNGHTVIAVYKKLKS